MKNIAYLSLGSNLGDRESFINQAVTTLNSHESIQVLQISSFYETEPVGFTEQGNFLNIVIEVETLLSAEKLLHQCLQVEKDLGRVREFKWGPRIIDLDILLYNQENVVSKNLLIPHPRMNERAFVLIPLVEIAPHLKHPSSLTPLLEVLDEIPDKEGVRLWKQTNGEGEFVHLES